MKEEIWVHKKTGNLYQVTDHAIDTTNERDGIPVVVYKNMGGIVFVREENEFLEKFEKK